MNKIIRNLSGVCLIAPFLLNACQPVPVVETHQPAPLAETIPATAAITAEPLPAHTSTPEPQPLLTFDPLTFPNPFCQPHEKDEHLLLSCDQDVLRMTQTLDRRRVDAILMREVSFQSSAARMEFEISSLPADGEFSDHNQFGLFFIDQSQRYQAVRVEGQQFTLETWTLASDGIQLESQSESVFLPIIRPNGQPNLIAWQCSQRHCDFFVNQQLAARQAISQVEVFQGGGFFAAADWDHLFGELAINALKAEVPLQGSLSDQPLLYEDDLTSDRGTFTQAGLSGAYDLITQEGFHFSPLIPFETYAVQGGPALVDYSVSTTVRINLDPTRPASKFAGLMCRSSAAGSYAGVLRADGVFFLYRSTPGSPFGLLAKGTYNDIPQPGWTDVDLRLECVGNQIDFYINELLLASVVNKQGALGFGRAGLFAKAGGDPNPDEFIYSNLVIRQILPVSE